MQHHWLTPDHSINLENYREKKVSISEWRINIFVLSVAPFIQIFIGNDHIFDPDKTVGIAYLSVNMSLLFILNTFPMKQASVCNSYCFYL